MPAAAADRKQEVYGLIAGTVFRDSGLSLAGAEVELAASSPAAPRKVKKMKQVSDSRGEFAFRVPAAEGEYTVSVRAKGYRGDQKQVKISGEERQDVFFRLEPASE